MNFPSKDELSAARTRILGMVHRTPVLTSTTFDEITGASVFFKCENFQRMGAFKMRAASHALSMLSQAEQARGVVTHSSGNFAQALALASRIRKVKATIVMPGNAPAVKVEAVKGYGAEIVFSGSHPSDREDAVEKIIKEKGATFIHPSNDLQVIIGNSTCVQELIEEVSDLHVIVAPVGGGGLLAGTALAVHAFIPSAEVYAAEPENADDAYRSLQSGKIEHNHSADTLADGLRTHLGDINFPIIRKQVEGVLLVSEEEIVSAMKWIWERMKIVIEPSAAVAVAAVWRHKHLFEGKRTGVILSGGNVDLREALKAIERQHT